MYHNSRLIKKWVKSISDVLFVPNAKTGGEDEDDAVDMAVVVVVMMVGSGGGGGASITGL